MRPYTPPPDPKQIAESQTRLIKAMLWIIAIPLLVFVIMAFGYSDAAPAFLRTLTIQLDALFGSPVWSILDPRKPS
ncbi:MAG TPA: hypothetical protein VIG34_02235 [Xanthobacteraceae bacterium]|jgi:hypothetical protein